MDLTTILYAGYLAVAAFGQPLEKSRGVSTYGAVQAIHADGTLSLRLVEGARTEKKDGAATHVTVAYRDENYPFFVDRHIVRWPDCEVVETWLDIRHGEEGPVRLVKMDSFAACLPGRPEKVKVMTLAGRWGQEAGVRESELAAGQTLATSSREGVHNAWESNPAMMVSFGDATEDAGEVLGVALEWTGTSAKSVRREWDGETKVFIGVDNMGGPYTLDPGKTLRLPRALLVLSKSGKGEVSRQFHRWAHLHLMPHGSDLHPVLLNSWEGSYFTFTEKTLTDMMDGVREMGGEMFVLDDGWFGRGRFARDEVNKDTVGLGDWIVNDKKLPHGLGWLSDQAKARGLKFGLWVEPEMVNTVSQRATDHPEWLTQEPKRAMKLGRGKTQNTLDMTNPALRDDLFRQIDATYSQIPDLAYVKWDANNPISNFGSTYLARDRQANLWFDYTKGLYELLARFQAKRPHVMTQACASGGGHMDFGFLRYADEFWTSDVTDPVRRVFIQWGASQFYPASAMACHVTASPNHQTKRVTPLSYRFDVAMSGRMGFELHPKDLSSADLAYAKRRVAEYKRLRPVVQQGDLYRLVSPYDEPYAALMYVSADKTRAAVFALGLDRKLDVARRLPLRGLDPARTYRLVGGDLLDGKALMTLGLPIRLSGEYASHVYELVAEDLPKTADATARAEILWTRPICVETNRYIGWPTVCRLRNGDLLAVFSGDRDRHICPWGKVQLVRSTDGGETWSAPETIANTALDDRDAGIVQLPDGEVVVTWFTSTAFAKLGSQDWRRHLEKLSPETLETGAGNWLIRSKDNGKTWSRPAKLDNYAQTPHGPIVLRDGSLLQVGRTTNVRDGVASNSFRRTIIRVSRSTDGGRNWQVICPEIPAANGENDAPSRFHEPHVAQLPDGTLVAVVRYHGDGEGLATKGNGYMRVTFSKNGGRTWSPMAKTGMLGLPPHLTVLPDGRLLCVYGRRVAAAGFGEFACLSTDGGRTWDVEHEITLATSHCGDLGYPATAQLPDGTLLTVFYQQRQPGEKPCLMATKWRVPAATVRVRESQADGQTDRWFEEMLPSKDGVRLYTYGSAPKAGVKCPIIVTRNPYVKEEATDMPRWARSERAALARGYARVVQHVRGSGMSQGVRVPYEDERVDGLALLEHVRKLPWYNGEIFLEGGSYLTSVHWAYLDTNPPDVKGAALAIQEVNRYNVNFRNGFFKIGLHGGWFLREYHKTDHLLPRHVDVTLRQFPLLDFSTRCWGRPEPAFDNPLRHYEPTDAYWTSAAPGSGVEARQAMLKSTMPVLLRTGFYDIYTQGLCDMWREMPASRRANCALLIDAYDHGGHFNAKVNKGTRAEFPGGSRSNGGVSSYDWFDFCRTGHPCKKARPNTTRYYALWENAWIEEPALVDGARPVTLALGAGEAAFAYDPLKTPPPFPGSGGLAFGGMRVQPDVSGRPDVVAFDLPPVAERLDVRGRITAKLTVKSDCRDSSFYIRLCVDKGDGKFLLLRDDILSLCGGGRGRYAPGAERTLDYTFADHAFRLEKGDRLRVFVAGGSPAFAAHPNVDSENRYAVTADQVRTARNVVLAGKSSITLPVK